MSGHRHEAVDEKLKLANIVQGEFPQPGSTRGFSTKFVDM
jgi:hypothetical protein